MIGPNRNTTYFDELESTDQEMLQEPNEYIGDILEKTPTQDTTCIYFQNINGRAWNQEGGRLLHESNAERNVSTEDTYMFHQETKRKKPNNYGRRIHIQRFNRDDEKAWKKWKMQTRASTDLRHHRLYQNPHARPPQTVKSDLVANSHNAARLIAQKFTKLHHNSSYLRSWTHSRCTYRKYTHGRDCQRSHPVFMLGDNKRSDDPSARCNKGTATLVSKICQTQEVLIASYTVGSKEVRLVYIQRGCKKLHSSRFLYTRSYTHCRDDRIWFCGIREFFRNFGFPKGHPQPHNQPRLLAKSLKLGSHRRRVTKGSKDYVIQRLTAQNLRHGTRAFSRSFVSPNVHPGSASNSERSWRPSILTSSGNKMNTNIVDDSCQPWVPGAKPGTKTAQ